MHWKQRVRFYTYLKILRALKTTRKTYAIVYAFRKK